MKMAFRFRHVPPAGSPIGLADLAQWAVAARPGAAAASRLQAQLAARVGVPHVFLTSTGRAGMTLLLRAMRRLAPPHRTEVVVPAYTCFSVAASIVKAGLVPRVVDVDADTLDYDHEALAGADFSRLLAVVATNLYGLPNDLPSLTALAGRHGVFLVDDAAQALGASVGGRPSGTWGSAGLYSFDKGKNVSAVDGGVVVTAADDLAAAMTAELRDAPRAGAGSTAIMVAKAVAYAALLRPWLYWIPLHLPQLKLGQTVFTTDFSLAVPHPVESALAGTMLPHLDAFTAARVGNAAALLEGLRGASAVRPLRPGPDAVPVYLRLPVLAADGATRDRLLARLHQAGIGATGSYPTSLVEIPGLDRLPGHERIVAARDVARRIVTLPTHPYVNGGDIHRMVEVIGADTASVDVRIPGAA